MFVDITIHYRGFGPLVGAGETTIPLIDPMLTIEDIKANFLRTKLQIEDPEKWLLQDELQINDSIFAYSGPQAARVTNSNQIINEYVNKKEGTVLWKYFQINQMDGDEVPCEIWLEGHKRVRRARREEGGDDRVDEDLFIDSESESEIDDETPLVIENTIDMDQQMSNLALVDPEDRARQEAEIETLKELINNERTKIRNIDEHVMRVVSRNIDTFERNAEIYQNQLKEEQFELHRGHYSTMLNFMERQKLMMKTLAETSKMPGGLNDETQEMVDNFFAEMDGEMQNFVHSLAAIDRKINETRKVVKKHRAELRKQRDEALALQFQHRALLEQLDGDHAATDKVRRMMKFAQATKQTRHLAKGPIAFLKRTEKDTPPEEPILLKFVSMTPLMTVESDWWFQAADRPADMRSKMQQPLAMFFHKGAPLYEDLNLYEMGIETNAEIHIMLDLTGGGVRKDKSKKTKKSKTKGSKKKAPTSDSNTDQDESDEEPEGETAPVDADPPEPRRQLTPGTANSLRAIEESYAVTISKVDFMTPGHSGLNERVRQLVPAFNFADFDWTDPELTAMRDDLQRHMDEIKARNSQATSFTRMIMEAESNDANDLADQAQKIYEGNNFGSLIQRTCGFVFAKAMGILKKRQDTLNYMKHAYIHTMQAAYTEHFKYAGMCKAFPTDVQRIVREKAQKAGAESEALRQQQQQAAPAPAPPAAPPAAPAQPLGMFGRAAGAIGISVGGSAAAAADPRRRPWASLRS